MKNIAILASGSGSNAENIFNYFKLSNDIEVSLFLTNNPSAFVIKRAEKLGVECLVFDREQMKDKDALLSLLKERGIDYIVLAGFLWLLPDFFVEAYANRIINIHPSLLPSYGGKGMYGDKVHKAVVEAGEKYSGITIHTIDADYDKGQIVKQVKVEVLPTDSYEDVATKVHALEYEYFPRVIESELSKF